MLQGIQYRPTVTTSQIKSEFNFRFDQLNKTTLQLLLTLLLNLIFVKLWYMLMFFFFLSYLILTRIHVRSILTYSSFFYFFHTIDSMFFFFILFVILAVASLCNCISNKCVRFSWLLRTVSTHRCMHMEVIICKLPANAH